MGHGQSRQQLQKCMDHRTGPVPTRARSLWAGRGWCHWAGDMDCQAGDIPQSRVLGHRSPGLQPCPSLACVLFVTHLCDTMQVGTHCHTCSQHGPGQETLPRRGCRPRWGTESIGPITPVSELEELRVFLKENWVWTLPFPAHCGTVTQGRAGQAVPSPSWAQGPQELHVASAWDKDRTTCGSMGGAGEQVMGWCLNVRLLKRKCRRGERGGRVVPWVLT